MIAAPRFCTVGMKSFSIHDLVIDDLDRVAARATLAWKMSGYWVAEWLPQIVTLVMSLTAAPAFLASCAIARLWSSRVIAVKRSRGMSGALLCAIRAVRVGRVTDHENPHVRGGVVVQRVALRLEDPAVGLEQVAALHPLRAGSSTNEQRDVDPVEGLVGVIEDVDAGQQREGTVVELHRGALGGLDGVGDLEQREVDRGVGAEQLAAGDAEQEGVADLAGGAGDGHSYGGIAHWSFIS